VVGRDPSFGRPPRGSEGLTTRIGVGVDGTVILPHQEGDMGRQRVTYMLQFGEQI